MNAMNDSDLRIPSPPGASDGQAYRVRTAEGLVRNVAPTLTRCLQIGLGRGFNLPFGSNWVAVDKFDPSPGITYAPSGPTVVMIVGVNGSGKTTTIAKLAHRLKGDGKKVLVAACDTFRAAAVEQLTVWCQRIGCEIVKNAQGSDPASVAHDACEKAKARGFDVVIVDTAGRLHTQAHLMRELEKIHKVVTRQIPGAPHETLMILDATTGQNAVTQAEMFSKSVQCTGIVLTKLDGTAKGGAIFAIKQKVGLPVKYVGVGEAVEDLDPFDPDAYVDALFS